MFCRGLASGIPDFYRRAVLVNDFPRPVFGRPILNRLCWFVRFNPYFYPTYRLRKTGFAVVCRESVIQNLQLT